MVSRAMTMQGETIEKKTEKYVTFKKLNPHRNI